MYLSDIVVKVEVFVYFIRTQVDKLYISWMFLFLSILLAAFYVKNMCRRTTYWHHVFHNHYICGGLVLYMRFKDAYDLYNKGILLNHMLMISIENGLSQKCVLLNRQ